MYQFLSSFSHYESIMSKTTRLTYINHANIPICCFHPLQHINYEAPKYILKYLQILCYYNKMYEMKWRHLIIMI